MYKWVLLVEWLRERGKGRGKCRKLKFPCRNEASCVDFVLPLTFSQFLDTLQCCHLVIQASVSQYTQENH